MSETVGRSEREVFADLGILCAQPGYVHALAYLCFRDNMILYANEVTEQHLQKLYDPQRLVRTEINTLIGLMVKTEVDWALPSPATVQGYVELSERLLLELHHALSSAFSLTDVIEAHQRGEANPFGRGQAMREPIFYAAESAYNFQYLDLAARKYVADAAWLQRERGFTIDQARAVAEAADRVMQDRFYAYREQLQGIHPDQWTMVPGFSFTAPEIAAYVRVAPEVVDLVLMAFSLPEGDRNVRFASLQDFNGITATPLLRQPNGEFLALQNYALAEAIYESPLFWMLQDKTYLPTLDRHRGEFTENFVAERLARVFGADRVLANVDIWQGKGNKFGEIDVLVLWADRAIIVQAKSKRLTLEARKGNDQIIRDDFQKSVQDAYDQALACAQCLGDSRYRFARPDGTEVVLPEQITEIFVFCVVSDHYPALSFQTRQFLKTRDVPRVRAAMVTDVFLIDVVTELLSTPLQFLSYVARRTRYGERLLASQELTILGYHLKSNLWFEDEAAMIQIADDYSAGVDVAMGVRRRGLAGEATPEGILTRYEGTTLGRILHRIEAQPEPAVLDQGFQLLELSEDALRDTSRMIDRQARRSAQDGLPHDFTMMFPDSSGLTIHCTAEGASIAAEKLQTYCVRRKYAQKADRWFGLCLAPGTAELCFGLRLSSPWVQSDDMDAATASMAKPMAPAAAYETLFRGGRSTPKIGRNEPCPCGSGGKYKKCCSRCLGTDGRRVAAQAWRVNRRPTGR